VVAAVGCSVSGLGVSKTSGSSFSERLVLPGVVVVVALLLFRGGWAVMLWVVVVMAGAAERGAEGNGDGECECGGFSGSVSEWADESVVV
jgi:hypothetical protein